MPQGNLPWSLRKENKKQIDFVANALSKLIFHLLRFLASLYSITPKTVSEYPSIPVTETGFLNINIETTTATAPFAFPST